MAAFLVFGALSPVTRAPVSFQCGKALTRQNRTDSGTTTSSQLVEFKAPLGTAPYMSIFDELRYVRVFFLTTARRLLHFCSTTASKVHTDITKLVHKYCTLLFADAPARVYQAMVDFNRWLAEVLEDTHTEGIVWEPTYSDNPWLALEEQQPQNASLDEAFTRDSTTTIQLLGTACEIYMERYERLQQTNIGLAVELEQLKIQLKEALVRAFDTQQILDREREVAALQTRRLVMGVQIGEHLSQRNSHDRGQIELHQQITDAFRMLDTVNAPREVVEEMPGLGREPTSENASEQRRSDESEGASAQTNEPEHTGDVEAGSANQEVVILCPLTKDDTAHPDPEVVSQSSQDHFDDSDPTPSSSDANDDRTDYSQLTQLRPREEKSGNWYQYALQTLKEKRNQRRLLRKTNAEPAEAPLVARPTPSVAYDKSSSFDAQEFVKLAATRENGEDLTWYRRALQHLKEERTSRLSLHDRESFASTISTID